MVIYFGLLRILQFVANILIIHWGVNTWHYIYHLLSYLILSGILVYIITLIGH